MSGSLAEAAPEGADTASVLHRVPFYETDAMGVVHHSNYVRYLEEARVDWLDRYDQPYVDYVREGFHFATTRVEVDYKHPVRFDDRVAITVWAEWVRGASLRLAYVLHVGDVLVATAATEHAGVDTDGRVRRIPKERRESLRKRVARSD